MKLIFVCAPFRGKVPWHVEGNIRHAEEVAHWILTRGHAPLCPHTMYRYFDKSISDETILAATKLMLSKCDAVYVTMKNGGFITKGMEEEVAMADELHIPVFRTEDKLASFLGE